MKVLLSGSGSGGHVYPCIAMYNYLKNKHDLTLLIFKEIDKKIYDSFNIKYIYIDNELSFVSKLNKISKIMKDNKFNKVITFGGKNSFLINLCAKLHNIDSYLFEQNAIMGKANKMSYLFVKVAFTNFLLNKKKEVNVGNPNSFILTNKKVKLFKNNKNTILITMGSLGSSSVSKVIDRYITNHNEYNYIYVLGNNVKTKLKDKDNLKIFNMYNPLTELINSVDIVISRAGASTLSELIAYSKPSIIIPSPYVANNHQYINAKSLYDAKAIEIIIEKDLNEAILASKITNLTNNIENYNKMKSNLNKLYLKNNFKKIEDVIFNDNI